MLTNIINTGTKEGQNLSEIKRIKLLNQIVLVFITAISIKMINEMIDRDLFGILVTLVLISSFSITLLFNKYRRYVFARSYMTFILTLAITLLNLFYGRKFGSEFAYFPLIMMVVIFFTSTKVKICWSIFFAINYLISSSYLTTYGPLFEHNLNLSSFYFMLASCYISCFLISIVFIKENRRYESEANQLLSKLASKNQHLEHANNELEKFAYVASHDLKTPLRNINSFLNLIQRKIKQGNSSEIEEYLEFAILNAKRMHSLIQDILEFSQLNSERTSFEIKDLNLVLHNALSNLELLIKERNAVIETSPLPKLLCNDSQLLSLFQNLIENGIKYNKSPQPHIQVECKDLNTEYQISISDNGIGIEEAYQDRVFEMFYRLHNQGEYTGTGIGLASCRKIVIYHGGNISLSSSIGNGSTFHIVLPKHSQDESLKQNIEAVHLN